MILSAFPLAALVAINMIDPLYYDEVKDTAAFVPAGIFVGVMLTINVIYMKIMTTIKV